VYGVLKFVCGRIKSKLKFFISTPNPEMLVAAKSDTSFRKILNSSDMALPDGVGLLWATNHSRVHGSPHKLTRLPGREVMVELFKEADKSKWRVFLLGASEAVNKKALDKARKQFGGARFDGDASLVVDRNGDIDAKVSASLEKDIVDKINKYKPDLLFVAFGAPKQEKWVARNFQRLKVGGVMVVGGSLDYYVGARRPVPRLLSRLGLEWVWRMVHERGHYKRVWRAVVVFPWLVLRERLGFG
jgi:N-acetylglucosaminyldiphosphoundecaprenol N-acetyl-beta-D-mannosaminyltransferase